MKNWLKNLRIPKTLLGLALIGAGAWMKNDYLVNAGVAIVGVGVASKTIKAAQGGDPFMHEKKLFNLYKEK